MKITSKYRLFEILPGAAIWASLIILIALSFIQPLWVIIFIIVYDLFWLFRITHFSFYLVISLIRHRKAAKIDWLGQAKQLDGFESYRHLIFLATYKEEYDVVKQSFEAIAKSNYPHKAMIVVLAGEERDKDNFLRIAERIKQEYASLFLDRKS